MPTSDLANPTRPSDGLSWPRTPGRAPAQRRGAALMMSMLVLLVLILIVWQIGIGSRTTYQVARNDVSLTSMDLAIESALLEVFEQLKADAEADAQSGQGGAAAGPVIGADLGGDPQEEEGAPQAPPADSRRDEWARPQRTEINEIPLRILIQDEHSKINVYGMLTENDDEAEKAFTRVARVIDLFREGTSEDIEDYDAEEMAEIIRDWLYRREEIDVPRPRLSTDRDEEPDQSRFIDLRELVAIEPFNERHFRDYRDEEGNIVHSLTSYLTCLSSLQSFADYQESLEEEGVETEETNNDVAATTAEGQGVGGSFNSVEGANAEADPASQGGVADSANSGAQVAGYVNLNTAPPVVLKSLFDNADVDPRFWDDVIDYRNEEDEEAEDPDAEPVLDEFGEEIVLRRYFSDVEQLTELDGWADLEPTFQADVARHVGTTSDVFTIYVTARRSTSNRGEQNVALSREEQEELEELGSQLTRTVACTVWRRSSEDGTELVPVRRWEVLDYWPYEILDFPGEER